MVILELIKNISNTIMTTKIVIMLSTLAYFSQAWFCPYGSTCSSPLSFKGKKGTYISYSISGDPGSMAICTVKGLGLNGDNSQCKLSFYSSQDLLRSYTVLWEDTEDFPAVHCITHNFGDGVEWDVTSSEGNHTCKQNKRLALFTAR